ncbi:MAG: L-histidine N(alpha)-methyltransferase [Gemmatimonadetes bacterium]|uniref:L-histidine N(Alpha)-methyltransferase n=1 Tax=Candidatus Kutchimonas denitrificans TaxID=3056748 RepID=A0AAE4ZC65_9BACT|nr:L-histidine N(alpha)-methyltransferase [Gemmatimonadota bacterium]NIR74860.1 L-histidine N(alpha)-methyltransferase [Candidatus Kutchimonas denitrificans]NIR99971.1 L-histidine N(alpha)-methyltransferase [Gemmatimonadota bacterium]NIT65555.1 L-histidine N(alpha)-methyltransferase [Gemmatimonadota bacterium]NIU52525.1 L-histidine N(alpha)-methyltransferase [Gemmatimonadota bacterium]
MSLFSTRFRDAVTNGTALVQAPGAEDTVMTFARSVAAGLSDDPKWLHCRFLYDAEGSRLFERITEQPEYYPTRTEAAILQAHADEIRALTGPVAIVELGSGYSVKTEHLLGAYAGDGKDVLYVPVDVSASALREANRSIASNFPAVRFTGITGPYPSAFPVLRQLSPQLVVFLGSTIGNFNPGEMTAFFSALSGHMPAHDFFLLGADLVKDPTVLEAAYNDAAGITARFTKNYFVRLNRELGAELDLDAIEHVAVWNPEWERMEIYAHFHRAQEIYIEPLDESYQIAAGERILIEISRKFRLPMLRAELAKHGFRSRRSFSDEKGWFALLLLERLDDRLMRRAPYPTTKR